MYRLFLFFALIPVLVLAGCNDSITGDNGEFDFSQGQSLTFESLASDFVTIGQSPIGNGQFKERANRVIRDQADFQAFWNNLHGHIDPTPAIPDVDFESEMVIAVVLGQRSSGGFSVAVDAIVRSGNSVGVRVKEEAPGANCVTPAVISSPFHVVKLERVTSEFSFVDEREVTTCN